MAPRNIEDWQVLYPEIKMRSAHLLRSHEWADCTFKFLSDSAGAGGSKGSNDSLDAHKLILSMASPVFAAMFYGNVGDKGSPVLISDIDLPTFSMLLDYIYTDEITLTSTKQAASLYGAAHKYILVHLEKKCLDYLFQNLNPHNVCQVYEFACVYDSEESLKNKCLELISTKTGDVLKSPSFTQIHVATLKKIVSMDSLNIANEMNLFNAILDYANNIMKNVDDQNRNVKNSTEENGDCSTSSSEFIAKTRTAIRQCLSGVIEQIRFLTMTPADIAENKYMAIVLSENEMLAIIANLVSEKPIIPMPDGFSTSKKKRSLVAIDVQSLLETDFPALAPCVNNASKLLKSNDNEATFKWEVPNFKGTNTERLSPQFLLRGLRWRIKIQPIQGSRGPKMFGYFLVCEGSPEHETWSCTVEAELRLLSFAVDHIMAVAKLEYTFTSETGQKGLTEFLEWRQVKNPKNGFIVNDTIFTEVHITAELPVYYD